MARIEDLRGLEALSKDTVSDVGQRPEKERRTARSLISRSKASFSRRSPARYLCSSQLYWYIMKYTLTAKPGLALL